MCYDFYKHLQSLSVNHCGTFTIEKVQLLTGSTYLSVHHQIARKESNILASIAAERCLTTGAAALTLTHTPLRCSGPKKDKKSAEDFDAVY